MRRTLSFLCLTDLHPLSIFVCATYRSSLNLHDQNHHDLYSLPPQSSLLKSAPRLLYIHRELSLRTHSNTALFVCLGSGVADSATISLALAYASISCARRGWSVSPAPLLSVQVGRAWRCVHQALFRPASRTQLPN